ncbi:MAG: hypothetical protein SPE05_00910 [Bacteroidales bacterium]|nr:hypothetical protein [Bacteroidales bacterium]MDY4519931.1 hypothetical protein [Bacteroidales bacterium]
MALVDNISGKALGVCLAVLATACTTQENEQMAEVQFQLPQNQYVFSQSASTICIFRLGQDGAWYKSNTVPIPESGIASVELSLRGASEVIRASYDGREIRFIAEANGLTFVAINHAVPNNAIVGGTALNVKLQSFVSTIDSLRCAAAQAYDSVAHARKTSKANVDETLLELNQLTEREQNKLTSCAMRIAQANGNNALGQIAFWLGVADDDNVDNQAYVRRLNTVSDSIKNFAPIEFISKQRLSAIATSVGEHFANARFIKPDSSSCSLDSLLSCNYNKNRSQPFALILCIIDPGNPSTPQTIADIKQIANFINNSDPKILSRQSYCPSDILAVCEGIGVDIVNKIANKFHCKDLVVADPDWSFSNAYGLRKNYPSFIVIDADGIIAERDLNTKGLLNWLSGVFDGPAGSNE